MSYCIMRARKLKTDGNVGASLSHAWRDRETPNADQSRTPGNQHIGATSRAEAMAKYRDLLPEKVRKNGVRCIEYLITASPDALTDPKALAKYYNDALTWLREKHGKNLFYAGLHTDEKTPHLYAYAVPLDERGKLNARFFLGGREKLTAMQDDFWAKVGKPAGLLRGIKGSRAKHQEVKRFYGVLHDPTLPKAPEIVVPKPPKAGILYDLDHWKQAVEADLKALVDPAVEKARADAIAGRLAVKKAKDTERLAAQKEGENRQLKTALNDATQKLLLLPLAEIEALRKRLREERDHGSPDRSH